MAKIVPSPLAPSEPFKLVFGNARIELDGSKKTSSYETDDPAVVASARSHPWVSVEIPKADIVVGQFTKLLDPRKDILSAEHPNARLAFDPEAVKAALPDALLIAPVAINAALDQDTKVEAGPVAQTLASAEADAPKGKTTKETK